MSGKTIKSRVRAFTVTAVILGVIWSAPRPAAAQTIHACVNNKTGALRIASSCKKKESPLSWNETGPAGPAGPPGQLGSVVNVQQLNLVNSSKKVLASLGTTSDGNVMTFYDSSGNKTLTVGNDAKEDSATLTTWDGNNIVAGTGVYRSSFGEANASNISGGGFGFNVADTTGKFRVAAGTTLDLSEGYFETIDPNGSSTGIVDDDRAQFVNQGFFANDLNGTTRSFVGNSLDGSSYNEVALFNSAGLPRTGLFNTATNGDGLDTFGNNGEPRIAAVTSTDDSVSGYNVFDGTSLFGTERVFAGLTSSGSTVTTSDASGVVTGHIP